MRMRTKKNKTAGVSTVLRVIVLLIVLLVASFFLLYFETYAGEQAVQKVNPCLCRLSVDRVAATKVFETPSRFALDCNTRYVNIKKDDSYKVKQEGERVDYHVPDKKKLKDALAREIILGWWEMGAGEKNPYPNLVTLTGGRNSRCVITSQVTVDQSIVDSFGGSITDFNNHLKNYDFNECGVQKKGRGLLGDQLYFDRIDFAQGGKPITLSIVWAATITEDLQRARWITEAGKKLAVVGGALGFIPGLNVVLPTGALSLTGAAGTAGGIGYNLATIDDDAYLFAIAVGPADEVGKRCGQLY